MSNPSWAKYVPDTETPVTPIPLEYHRFVGSSVPALKGITTTQSGGRSISLPAAFASYVSTYGTAAYMVVLTKQTFLPGGGELYIANKTTSGFTVMNSGSTFGEEFAYVVFWLPTL